MIGGIIGLVDSSLNFATSVVQRMNLKDKLKYIDRVRTLKLQFMQENGKPDGERIDSAVEKIRDLLLIETETMNNAMAAGVLEEPK